MKYAIMGYVNPVKNNKKNDTNISKKRFEIKYEICILCG
jgi:formate hydrogenlyase subunit 6/NADH:ubiquinone oxidoreductase subunit I